MSNQKIAVTGASGLLGRFLCSNLSKDHTVYKLDIADPEHPVDITKLSSVLQALSSIQPDVVIHLAAFTDVSAAHEERGDRSGIVYKVNVTGTEHVAKAATEIRAHLIHLSTAYVFDGEKSEAYTEEDEPQPIEWYGETKLFAEHAVTENAHDWTILRIDQPFHHAVSEAKPDLAHQIAAALRNNSLSPQFTDHYFAPTYIPNIINNISAVIEKKLTGLFHATNNETWTNFEFAEAVADSLGISGKIQPSSLSDYLKTAKRPYQRNTSLNSNKFYSKAGLIPISVREGLSRLEIES